MVKAPACPICGSRKTYPWAQATDLEYFTTDQVFDYLRCDDCGTLFIQPVPAKELARIYPSNYYSFQEGNSSLVERVKQALDRRMFRRLLRSLPGERLDVLDVGGGTGWMLDLVRQSDPRVAFTQVVDMDAKAKKRAVAKGHAYFQGTIERFSGPRKFHLVLMINLIEHVQDPVKVLQKVQKLLAPGGLLLIKTPNTDSWDARLFRRSNWGGYHCPRHWVLFDESSFKKALSRTRLELSSLTYTQGAPFWAQSVMMALRRMGLVSYAKEKPLVYHSLFGPLAALFAAFDILRGILFKTSQMFIVLKNPG